MYRTAAQVMHIKCHDLSSDLDRSAKPLILQALPVGAAPKLLADAQLSQCYL